MIEVTFYEITPKQLFVSEDLPYIIINRVGKIDHSVLMSPTDTAPMVERDSVYCEIEVVRGLNRYKPMDEKFVAIDPNHRKLIVMFANKELRLENAELQQKNDQMQSAVNAYDDFVKLSFWGKLKKIIMGDV